MTYLKRTITIVIHGDNFNINKEALQWAIDNAPAKYITGLIDTKSIIEGIEKTVAENDQ